MSYLSPLNVFLSGSAYSNSASTMAVASPHSASPAPRVVVSRPMSNRRPCPAICTRILGPEAFTSSLVSASASYVASGSGGGDAAARDEPAALSHRALYPRDRLDSAVSVRVTSKGMRGVHSSNARSRSQS